MVNALNGNTGCPHPRFRRMKSEAIEQETYETVVPVGVNESVVFTRFQPPTEVSPQ